MLSSVEFGVYLLYLSRRTSTSMLTIVDFFIVIRRIVLFVNCCYCFVRLGGERVGVDDPALVVGRGAVAAAEQQRGERQRRLGAPFPLLARRRPRLHSPVPEGSGRSLPPV